MRISVPTTKSCKRKGCSLRGGGFLRFGEELATEAKAAQPGGGHTPPPAPPNAPTAASPAPKTTSAMRALAAAPAHMGHGSKVT